MDKKKRPVSAHLVTPTPPAAEAGKKPRPQSAVHVRIAAPGAEVPDHASSPAGKGPSGNGVVGGGGGGAGAASASLRPPAPGTPNSVDKSTGTDDEMGTSADEALRFHPRITYAPSALPSAGGSPKRPASGSAAAAAERKKRVPKRRKRPASAHALGRANTDGYGSDAAVPGAMMPPESAPASALIESAVRSRDLDYLERTIEQAIALGDSFMLESTVAVLEKVLALGGLSALGEPAPAVLPMTADDAHTYGGSVPPTVGPGPGMMGPTVGSGGGASPLFLRPQSAQPSSADGRFFGAPAAEPKPYVYGMGPAPRPKKGSGRRLRQLRLISALRREQARIEAEEQAKLVAKEIALREWDANKKRQAKIREEQAKRRLAEEMRAKRLSEPPKKLLLERELNWVL